MIMRNLNRFWILIITGVSLLMFVSHLICDTIAFYELGEKITKYVLHKVSRIY